MAAKVLEHRDFQMGSSSKAIGLPVTPVFYGSCSILGSRDFYNGSTAKILNIILPLVSITSIGIELQHREFSFSPEFFSVLPIVPVFNTPITHEISIRGIGKLHPDDTGKLIAFGYTFLLRFLVVPDSGYAPLTVRFINQSQSPVDDWLWTFGDGDSSVSYSTIHTFNSAGRYIVTLQSGSPEFGYEYATAEVVILDRTVEVVKRLYPYDNYIPMFLGGPNESNH